MKILVTGSRDWDDPGTITKVLFTIAYGRGVQYGADEEPTLFSGACPQGADYLAESLATVWGWQVHRFPARWDELGKGAGFVRNKEMVALKPDICVAFRRGGVSSKGTTHCGQAAEAAGIETIWIEYEDTHPGH